MNFGIGKTGFGSVSNSAFREAEIHKNENRAESFKDQLSQAINREKSSEKASSKEESDKQEKIDQKNQQLMEAGIKFEAFFLHQVMQGMRDTIERSDLFGDSHERDIYEGMFDEAITEEAAEAGGIGLAEQIYEENKYEDVSELDPGGESMPKDTPEDK